MQLYTVYVYIIKFSPIFENLIL